MERKNRGYLEENTLKRIKLMHFEVPNGDGTAWKIVKEMEKVEHHITSLTGMWSN
jgi:hypothetical protein